MQSLWAFSQTPLGTVIFILVSVAWLTLVVVWPELKVGKRKTVQRLTELADQGTNDLQNRLVKSDLEVYHLWADYGVWERQLLDIMEQCHCKTSDITRIKQLNTFTPRGFSGLNPYHAEVKEWIAEKVARLREIIRQIEQ